MPSTRQGRRSGEDRRVFAVYYRQRSDRREDPDRRRDARGDELPSALGGANLWREYWGASDEEASAE
jgi:hypothetical protein